MDSTVQRSLRIPRRQYLQLVEPNLLRWPDDAVLKAQEVQTWIFDHLFNSEMVSTLPPERYQLRVLKSLTARIERSIEDPEEDEVSDQLMSHLASLLSSNIPSESDSAQQKAFVTYTYPTTTTNNGLDERAVTLLESRSIISSSGTTGLRTWEAALVLGQFLCSERGAGIIDGKNILELGAGTGMLSILCAKHLGVSGIVSTDGDEAVVDAIKANLFINGLDTDEKSEQGPKVETAALKWGRPINGSSFEEDYGMAVPDVILGADVTYDSSVIPSLVYSLREFLELNPSAQVLICATIRNEQTIKTFQTACGRNRLHLEAIEFPPVAEDLQEGPFYPTGTRIQIWRIIRSDEPHDPFSI